MPRHIAVIGASLGGLRTVEALRRLGDDSRITLVGDEATLPYDRPPLSKDVLLGKAESDAVRLTNVDALTELDVDLLLGTRATGLDLARRTVRLEGGLPDLSFDALVIATGSAPRPLPGTLLSRGTPYGVHALRTLEDAVALRRAFETGPRVVVLGGGFIGAEVASSARALGLDVTIVDIAPVLMQRGLGDVIGQRMTAIAREAGVDVRLGVSVAEVLGTDRVEGVRLTDGSTVAADLLVVGLGTTPNVGWLEGSGLRIQNGVVCDEYLAAAPDVYAVGDVARWLHPGLGRLVRCEHWTAVGEHADTVAATLTGTPTVADSVPYVWSDQFDHKLQIAGLLEESDEVRLVLDAVLDDGRPKFVAVAGSSGHQHAAFALNAPGALIRQRMKLATAPPWPPETG